MEAVNGLLLSIGKTHEDFVDEAGKLLLEINPAMIGAAQVRH